MAEKTPTARAIARLLERYVDENNITSRASQLSEYELRSFTVDDIEAILKQISAKPKKGGSNALCGPDFNRHDPIIKLLRIPIWALFIAGATLLLPMQLYALLHLLVLGRFRAIWKEIPVPTVLLFRWSSSMNAWVKAPLSMIRKSVKQRSALCVNRSGRFALKIKGYAVLSHVWDETCGWTARGSRGPVDPELRKQGIDYTHFLKFFDRCDAEWLWVDLLAIPEVFEDMNAEQKAETEDLRTGVLNSSRNIYTRAEKVVCLDDLLLRLPSGGMIDVAVVLCLGTWMHRLWPFTETWLAKRVILKTEDSGFDLDVMLEFLYNTVNNVDHRYFPIFQRLAPLRPLPQGQRYWVTSPVRPDSTERNVFVDIYSGSGRRACKFKVDEAKALFPVLNLKWVSGWTLQQGFGHIFDSYPEEQDILIEYCKDREIDVVLPSSDCSQCTIP